MNQWIELEKVTSLIHSLLKISLYIKLNIENHFFQIITFHSELEAGGTLNKKVVLSINDTNISYRFGYSVGDVFMLLFFLREETTHLRMHPTSASLRDAHIQVTSTLRDWTETS